jgi:hypothetical protein
VSAQHGDFVTQDQDLDVLGCVGAAEQRQPGQHAGEDQVRESEGHGGRSCWEACEPSLRGRLAAKALVRGRDTVLGTHTIPAGHTLKPTSGTPQAHPDALRELARWLSERPGRAAEANLIRRCGLDAHDRTVEADRQ